MNIYTLLQQVNRIYQNPLQYTYILHKNDGFLHFYDEGTMQILGKTRVLVLQQMRLFAFTKDFSIFFGIRQGKLMQFQLIHSGYILHTQINQQDYHHHNNSHTHSSYTSKNHPKPYFQSYYLNFSSQKQSLFCITKKNIFVVNPLSGTYSTLPQIYYNFTQIIYPQFITQINDMLWIIGYKDYIYFMRINSDLNGYIFYDRLYTKNIRKLDSQNNVYKQYLYVINEDNQIRVIKIDKINMKIIQCFKYKNQNIYLMYMVVLRPGVDTSTTMKNYNILYLAIYGEDIYNNNQQQQNKILCQQQQQNAQYNYLKQKMIDQNQQNQQNKQKKYQNRQQKPKSYSMLIIPTQIQKMTQFFSQQSQQKQQSIFSLIPSQQHYIIKQFPFIKNTPWVNILNQNKILFLTNQNKVCFINLCEIKQLKLIATQWACMGYKFQVLEQNQVYQEKQNQYEDQSQIDDKEINKNMLDDWSESLVAKGFDRKKYSHRIRIIDF